MHKIIINLGVAADEQSNVVGERFSDSDTHLLWQIGPRGDVPPSKKLQRGTQFMQEKLVESTYLLSLSREGI